ncbi:MAG: stage V sporulation protein G [Planctomycetaceae bacterium]|nr:MAG: stage V sporulation protein G [Planctomycetaceae bacterium]
MKITEVRIKLMENSDDRLRAFCSITFDDCFVVRDLKIIEGTNGPFVAMPSRKLTGHCPHCGAKNHLRAFYCNQCGKRLDENRTVRDVEGRIKLYADIAHPINSECREAIQERVIAEYEEEVRRSQQPGYSSRYDDSYGEDDEDDFDRFEEPVSRRSAPGTGVSRHIQPAESTPPPPHSTARPSASPGAGQSEDRDSFGAGIFD